MIEISHMCICVNIAIYQASDRLNMRLKPKCSCASSFKLGSVNNPSPPPV